MFDEGCHGVGAAHPAEIGAVTLTTLPRTDLRARAGTSPR